MTLTKKSFYLLLIPTVFCAAGLGQSAMADTTAQTIISAHIVGGGCQISVDDKVQIRDGNLIPADEIMPDSDISQTFELTIKDCKGYGLTPSITIDGNIDNSSGKWLFVNLDSKSKGYGILLSTDGNEHFNQSSNLGKDKKITAKKDESTDWEHAYINDFNGKIPLKATLSCGTCTDNQGGELTASLTFTFVYQ